MDHSQLTLNPQLPGLQPTDAISKRRTPSHRLVHPARPKQRLRRAVHLHRPGHNLPHWRNARAPRRQSHRGHQPNHLLNARLAGLAQRAHPHLPRRVPQDRLRNGRQDAAALLQDRRRGPARRREPTAAGLGERRDGGE